jgi:hypothetical protein
MIGTDRFVMAGFGQIEAVVEHLERHPGYTRQVTWPTRSTASRPRWVTWPAATTPCPPKSPTWTSS